ncbi:MAG: NAD(P)-dependent oxidoreductase [Caldimonas sp.]
MRAVFVDANAALRSLAEAIGPRSLPALELAFGDADIVSDALPEALAGAPIAVIDHTALPLEVARRCTGLRDVVFLGTGARSYMDPEALASIGITVHLIKGYGDTAVAECTIGLLFAAARNFAAMDRAMREGRWLRSEGTQLAGKTLGLIGYGGIAAEVARMANGIGMKVLAWNRTPRGDVPEVEFVAIERLLAESDAVSLHLLLTAETRGFLSAARIAAMRRGALLVNTARGALVDEAALVAALRSGHIAHAGLDVFDIEPMPPGHVLATLANVTLSAHSGFRTPEANRRLIEAAFDHCRRLVAAPSPLPGRQTTAG